MTKLALVRRLRRIEGQMRGLQKMVEQDRSCADLLTQIASAREALRQAAVALLRDHLTLKTRTAFTGDNRDEDPAVAELVGIFGRWVK
ncbi:MAG: metal-sensitive transcriptional regulator [Gemmatimonadales bacterium]